MPKPILLSVDDDSDVLRAIERVLRSQYGAEYRVIGSDSPEKALDILKQLKVRSDRVALMLADQRMPRMNGVEFLQEGMQIFPDAKRALLTAYADTNAAITGALAGARFGAEAIPERWLEPLHDREHISGLATRLLRE